MLEFRISSNFDKLENNLQNIYKDQLPFATAVALTRLAQAAQSDVIKTLEQTFIIRNKYVRNSIKITPAKKKDWPNCFSVVGTKAKYMDLQVEGGEKKATMGVPLGVPKEARKTPQSILGQSSWVKTLLKKHGFITIRAKYGTELLLQQFRTGRRRNSKPNKDIVIRSPRTHTGKRGWQRETIYALRKSVTIVPRWDFWGIVNESQAKNYERIFLEEFSKAIDTAR